MRFFKENKDILIFACGIALYAVLAYLLHIPCPIYYFTGFSCPGCGMTRALFSALKLDFSSAFTYHPLWICLPFVLIALVVFRNRNRRIFRLTLYLSIVAMLLTYALRIVIGSEVLVFDFKSGAIYRGISAILSIFN